MAEAPLVAADEAETWLAKIAGPVAITGGTGFVGSHLVDTLCAADVRPRVLVRNPAAPRWIADRPVEWITGDLDDAVALAKLVEGAGTVLHLAGVVRAGSTTAFDRGNRQGTRRLVTALEAEAPTARLVHVSSLAAAGPSPTIDGLGPDAEPHPVSAYGRSKLAAESEVRALGDDRAWVVLRPPAIYGPRDTDVLEFFKMAACGVVAIPSGERWVTLAWVGDVVRAVLAAAGADAPVHRVLHLGEPLPYRLPAVVRLLADAGGVRARVVPVPGMVLAAAGGGGSLLHRLGFHRVAMTRDKARELLARHWTARTAESLAALNLGDQVPFPEGAAITWEWYRAVGWVG